MRLRKAATLLEIIVVIGIILILASIVTPAIARARFAAKQTASISNLRQIYLGLMLYRESQDGRSEYGTAEEMGLPRAVMSSSVYLDVVRNKDVWRSPCCCHKDSPSGNPDYTRYVTDYWEIFHTEDIWAMYVTKWEGNSILVGDYHCNDKDLNLYVPRRGPVRGLGIRLNGKAENRIRRIGISDFEAFWNR